MEESPTAVSICGRVHKSKLLHTLITNHSIPGFEKISLSLSSALIRVLGSGLREEARICKISELMVNCKVTIEAQCIIADCSFPAVFVVRKRAMDSSI